MNKQQEKDAIQCERMQERGEDKKCFGCSCNVCLVQIKSSSFINPYKERILEKIQDIKDDIPYGYGNSDEMFGATTTLNQIVKIIKETN